jgi:hypothetical protein
MNDDVFRIVITVAVALAAVAFLVQAGIVIALYGTIRKMQRKVLPLVERAHPVIDKAGPAIDKATVLMEKAAPAVERVGPILAKTGSTIDKAEAVLAAAQQVIEDTRPRVAEISTEVAAIVRSSRDQVERIGELLHDAGDRARMRLEQIDHSVESTVAQVGEAGETMKRAVMRPVREANGIAAGISAVVSTLVRGRKSSVDSATQDEEMFI